MGFKVMTLRSRYFENLLYLASPVPQRSISFNWIFIPFIFNITNMVELNIYHLLQFSICLICSFLLFSYFPIFQIASFCEFTLFLLLAYWVYLSFFSLLLLLLGVAPQFGTCIFGSVCLQIVCHCMDFVKPCNSYSYFPRQLYQPFYFYISFKLYIHGY